MYIYLLAYVVHQYTYKNIMKWYQLQLPSSLKYLGSIWMYNSDASFFHKIHQLRYTQTSPKICFLDLT